jgi:transposase
MLGTKARLFTPVSARSLDDLVPADQFYRHLDRVLDLSLVRDLVQDCYSADAGRPSIDPVVFFKLQLVLFFDGIRSERHLMRLAADRLSVRWYLGYNLDEAMPDHASLTRIRVRYGLEVFRRFFEAIVAQCQQAGLVWGRERYFDATQVQADAALESLTARFAVEARQARAARAADGPDENGEALREWRGATRMERRWKESRSPNRLWRRTLRCSSAQVRGRMRISLKPRPRPPCRVLSLTRCGRSCGRSWRWPMPPAMTGSPRRADSNARCVASRERTADFRISTSDPDATPLRLKGGGTHLGYQTHYVVNGGKRRISVGVLVAPGEVMENQPMLDLLWRARSRWRLRVRQVTGDTK